MISMDGAKKKLNKEIHNKLASIGQSTLKFFFRHKGKMPPQCVKRLKSQFVTYIFKKKRTNKIALCSLVYPENGRANRDELKADKPAVLMRLAMGLNLRLYLLTRIFWRWSDLRR